MDDLEKLAERIMRETGDRLTNFIQPASVHVNPLELRSLAQEFLRQREAIKEAGLLIEDVQKIIPPEAYFPNNQASAVGKLASRLHAWLDKHAAQASEAHAKHESDEGEK